MLLADPYGQPRNHDRLRLLPRKNTSLEKQFTGELKGLADNGLLGHRRLTANTTVEPAYPLAFPD